MICWSGLVTALCYATVVVRDLLAELRDFDVDKESEPKALQEVKDERLLAVKESQLDKVSVGK